MTYHANRNNVKTFVRCITWMVVLLRSFGAICTNEISRWLQFAKSNGITNGSLGFCYFGMSDSIQFGLSAVCYLALFTLFIFSGCYFTLFSLSVMFLICVAPSALMIFFTALLALTMITTRSFGTLLKFRQGLYKFAASASFRYDFVSHICSLEQVWSEPFTRPILVCGSHYFNTLTII